VILGRVLKEILLPERGERLHKVGRAGHGLEPLGELLPITRGNTGNQRFLAVEIDVERPGADGRRAADILHGRAMKTGVCNAALGGIENVLAARLLRFRSEFRHCEPPSFDPHLGPGRTPGARTASHKRKRTVVLFAKEGGGVRAKPAQPTRHRTTRLRCGRRGSARGWRRGAKRQGKKKRKKAPRPSASVP
jgi:hypothetical protein